MKTNALRSFFSLLSLFSVPLQAQWIPQAENHLQSVLFVDNIRVVDTNHVWAGISYRDTNNYSQPGVARTTDGGAGWQLFIIPGTEGYVSGGLSALGADTAFLSLRESASSGRLYRTSDGGQNWELVFQGSAAGYKVHFFDAQYGMLYRGPYNIKITTDGGVSWNAPSSVPPGLPPDLVNPGILSLLGSDIEIKGNSFLAGLKDGRLLRSDDRGDTWQAFSTPVSTPISDLAFEDTQTGLAAAIFNFYFNGNWYDTIPSRLFRTIDGGLSWTEIPATQLPFSEEGLAIRSITATGAPGDYIMQARIFNQGGGFPATYRSEDGGFTWQEVSTCPRATLNAIEFKSPEAGWAGVYREYDSGPLFYKWGTPAPLRLTLSVDLGNAPPSPQGVHIITNQNNWDPAATPMTHVSGSIWSVDLTPEPGADLQYRFVNGNTPDAAEAVPAACGVEENGIIVRKATRLQCGSLTLLPVLIGHCLPSGELAPQTNTICENNGAYLICENFDNYQQGKLGVQSTLWQALGCNFFGIEGDSCDVDLNGFADGFANYSGQWAMHPNGGYGTYHDQYIQLNLGDLHSGKYELSMQIYVPAGRYAYFDLLFDPIFASYSSVFLAFSPDGVLTYNKYNGETSMNELDTTISFTPDKWHEIRLVFDLNLHRREFWWDGVQQHTENDPHVNQLIWVAFYGSGGGYEGLFAPNEYLIDDIKLRDMNFVDTKAPASAEISSILLFPNPASEEVNVQYRLAQSGESRLLLINALGQTIRAYDPPQGSEGIQKIDLKGLPKGIYEVQLLERHNNSSQHLVLH